MNDHSPAAGNIAATVFQDLRRAILSGEFSAGERLPGERELAQKYQTNRNTLREAVRRIYGPGKTTAFDAPGWIVQTTFRVKKVVPLDEKQYAEAFEVAIPLGVKVYDGVEHDTYVLGQERSGTLGPWTRTFMVGLAALAACAVIAGCVRWIRSRSA